MIFFFFKSGQGFSVPPFPGAQFDYYLFSFLPQFDGFSRYECRHHLLHHNIHIIIMVPRINEKG